MALLLQPAPALEAEAAEVVAEVAEVAEVVAVAAVVVAPEPQVHQMTSEYPAKPCGLRS